MTARFCAACGKKLARRRLEALRDWIERRTCGRGCAASLRESLRAGDLVLPCKSCGKPLQPREGEPPSRFLERQFCEDARCKKKTRELLPRVQSRPEGLSIDSVGVDARGLAITARIVSIDKRGNIVSEELIEISIDLLIRLSLVPSKRRSAVGDDDE